MALITASLSSCAPSGTQQPWTVYVTSETAGTLSVIDGDETRVTGVIPIGSRLRGVQMDPDGETVWLAASGSPIGGPGVDEHTLPPADKAKDGLIAVRLRSQTVSKVVRGVSDPEQLAVGKSLLFVASEDRGTADVISKTGHLAARVTVGDEPEGIALTPDAKQVYVTSEGDNSVAVIDATAFKEVAYIPVGERPRSVIFSKDGSRAFVSNELGPSIAEVDTVSHTVVRKLVFANADWKPMGLALSPRGDRLYVSMGRGGAVAEIETRTLVLKRSVKVPGRPWGIGISPDGSFLFTANGPADSVSKINTKTMTLDRTIDVPGRPWGIAIAPRRY